MGKGVTVSGPYDTAACTLKEPRPSMLSVLPADGRG